MRTLQEIYEDHKGPASYGDKGTIHSYIEVYAALLAPFRETAKRVLEIGVLGGHSILMWEKYFTQAEVHGIDISLTPLDMFDLTPLIMAGHKIHIFDATDASQVANHFAGMTFDVVIDDASHLLDHQLAAYRALKPHMSPGGIYIIEDIEDIERMRPDFEKLDPSKTMRVIDRRGVKGRFDDVLITFQSP